MAFHNEPVAAERLPALEEVSLTPVSARFLPYRILGSLLFWVPLALIVGLVPIGPDLPLLARGAVAGVVAGFGILVATLAALEARRRAYALRQEDLIHVTGLLVQRTTVLPVCRIQHVETASGPLERAFGIMRLTCYTAGGSSADLVLAGLRPETAESIRQFLLQRIRARDSSPPAESRETDKTDENP